MEDIFSFSRKWITVVFPLLRRTSYLTSVLTMTVNIGIIIYETKIADGKVRASLSMFMITCASVSAEIVVQLFGGKWFKLVEELDEIRWPISAAGKRTQHELLKVVTEYKSIIAFQMLSAYIGVSMFLSEIRYIENYVFLLNSYVPNFMLRIFCYIYYTTQVFLVHHFELLMNSSVYFVYHIRTQLILVNHLIKRIEKDLESLNDNLYQQQINHRLRKCIQHHQHIFRLFIKFRNTVNKSVFVFVPIASIGAVGVFLHYLESSKLIPFSIYVVAYFGGVITFIHSGGSVVIESLNTASATALTTWYKWNRTNRLLLLYFLVNTQRPMIICVGSSAVKRELFLQTMKTAYSFCCVLYSVQNSWNA